MQTLTIMRLPLCLAVDENTAYDKGAVVLHISTQRFNGGSSSWCSVEDKIMSIAVRSKQSLNNKKTDSRP